MIDDDNEKEFSTIKPKIIVHAPSSWKFNARARKTDDAVLLKLEVALMTMLLERNDGVDKSHTNGEINSEKTSLEHGRPGCGDGETLLDPPSYSIQESSCALSRKYSKQPASYILYQKLMLNAWRNTRNKLKKQVQSLKVLQEENHQLRLDVQFLSSLRNFEYEKCLNALDECKREKKKLNREELKSVITKFAQDRLKTNCELLRCDLEKYNERLVNWHEQWKNYNENQINLFRQLKNKSRAIIIRKKLARQLEKNLKESASLQNFKSILEIKISQRNNIIQLLRSELDINENLKKYAAELVRQKIELDERHKVLHKQLGYEKCHCRNGVLYLDMKMDRQDSRFRHVMNLNISPMIVMYVAAQIVLPIIF